MSIPAHRHTAILSTSKPGHTALHLLRYTPVQNPSNPTAPQCHGQRTLNDLSPKHLSYSAAAGTLGPGCTVEIASCPLCRSSCFQIQVSSHAHSPGLPILSQPNPALPRLG